MANEFTGTIRFIGAAENVGKKKPFIKRIFVADDSVDERYPNPVPFELTRGDTEKIDGFSVGDDVVVEYYLNGREWDNPKTGKKSYFLSAHAVAVKRAEAVGETEEETEEPQGDGAEGDDIPF